MFNHLERRTLVRALRLFELRNDPSVFRHIPAHLRDDEPLLTDGQLEDLVRKIAFTKERREVSCTEVSGEILQDAIEALDNKLVGEGNARWRASHPTPRCESRDPIWIHFDSTTDTVRIELDSGGEIASGWTDTDDPDALLCGDWISVNDRHGQQLLLLNTDDFMSQRRAQESIYKLIQACARTFE